MTIRVLIAEDHQLLRKGLHSMISAMPNYEVVGEAGDGREAIREAAILHPDLVLMDLSMPGITGFEALVQIKRRSPEVRSVILTGYDNEEFIREALRVGADGYVLKGASFEEFAFALQLVVRGKKFICNQVSMQMLDNYLQGDAAPAQKSEWDMLTERERNIMKLIGEGYTNRAAGEFLCISSKTVEKHRASLMRKLGLRNAAELVVKAMEMGLVERPARRAPPPPAVARDASYTLPAMDLSVMADFQDLPGMVGLHADAACQAG